MTYYEVTMQHNADSLLALSRMQYDLFCTRQPYRPHHPQRNTRHHRRVELLRLVGYSAAGVRLLSHHQHLCVTGSHGAQAHRADKAVRQAFPLLPLLLRERRLHIFAMPENKELDPLPYSEVERVGENASYFFIFRDQFGGYMVPKDALGDKVDGFRKFIEEKTGKPVALKASPFRRHAQLA